MKRKTKEKYVDPEWQADMERFERELFLPGWPTVLKTLAAVLALQALVRIYLLYC